MTTIPQVRTALDRSILGPENPAVPFDHPFRAEFASWLAEHVPAGPAPEGEDALFAQRRDWQATMHRGGWAGLTWPREYGGRADGPLTQLMAYEELALHRAPEPANTPGMILLGPTLMQLGTEELKQRFLPRILSGEDLFCQGFSEPDSGSDLASLRTRARLDGGFWVIDGQKIWTTFADRADYCFVLARTEPDSVRHRGLTLLICPTDQPGVTIRTIEQISGDHEFAEVFFDGVHCPASWVVGEPGQGWSAAMTLFQFERGDPGYTDHARLLVELVDARDAVRAAGARVSQPARADLGGRAVDLWRRCQELRALNVRLALLAEAGGRIAETGSVTNLVWGELAKDVADLSADAAELTGTDLRVAIHHRLASRAKSIYSGTTEIQRTVIAERLLGLPR
ncbi:acyl-CoA dehydrogenase family protein [Pseudonocardia kujensis]|uniref:acyl-CoA dehydrogenase family protein n=1 Tax=Pseudonocardia kujensis TaxID=1128675 RepID=UPI001E611DF0|nr:acyl-CoA dehydrogenase family protein [Pseudonocardia kujensis]MCE0761980.1 acyl-CoA dehydrogenase family protein [Pseudonocardia kujensis]